ncbi:MAG: aldo/keto reductase [Actinomycetales bacterium]|nr:aldo/keto reductase [Actinomycetales bacterium]
MTAAQQPLAPTRRISDSDLVVSPLCFGGNVFGWTADRDQSFAVLDAYAEAGGNFIDTADVYSEWIEGNTGGDSERILGEWLAARGNRDQMVIATKVAKLSTHRGLAPANIRSALDDSLQRLQTDYIDLYYSHEDDESVPIEDVLGTYRELMDEGKIRYIAESNFTPERLRESLDVARAHDLPAYIAVQDHYNLMERAGFEATFTPIALEYGLSVLPYYSLARGFLTGKYRAGVTIDSPRAKGATPYVGERGDRVLGVLETVAAAHDATIPAVALAWLLAQPAVAAPLASARNVEQLSDLLAMGTIELTAGELAAINEVSS